MGEVATTCDALGLGAAPGGQNCGQQGKSCADGVCVDCVPKCDGKECGDDGCGGSCGECAIPPGATCATAVSCVEGICLYEVQQFYCVVDDSCVPSGTENPDNPCEKCNPNENQNGWSPAENGVSCGDGLTCHDGNCCDYDCDGKVCGDDGCGGVCGNCDDGLLCCEGQCQQCCDGNDVPWDGCTQGEITEFRVNTTTWVTGEPDVAVAPGGAHLVVWGRYAGDATAWDVF